MEGFIVVYKAISENSDHKSSTQVVHNVSRSQYTVLNLDKFVTYEIFIVPFFKIVLGQPSNSKLAQTLEDGEILNFI